MLRRIASTLLVLLVGSATLPGTLAQGREETFTATASLSTAGGTKATTPVTIVVSRTMTQDEAAKLTGAFSKGGAAALRAALKGVPPTGSIRVGNSAPVAARLTLERVTDRGRLLTIVTDKPIAFLGAGLPNAKAKEGYDFGVLDIEVNASGAGSGTLSPAAKIQVKDGAFVVDDYAAESVRLVDVKKK